jgi:hypothetical protein
MARHTKRRSRRSMKRNTQRRKRHGGAATVFPLSYFSGKAPEVSAPAGRDLLHASGLGVRPSIGPVSTATKGGSCGCGMRRQGGFYPSVMGSFTHSASKYIVPMTLYAGYKMLKKSQQKSQRRTRKR